MTMAEIKQAETDEEINGCFDIMLELRPNLIREDFINQIREMEKQAYKLAYIENSQGVVCVAGFRVSNNLFMGKNFYVDDLVTTEKTRSEGFGEKMISYLRALAIESQCNVFHLDSGTQRHQAHKFYFKQNLTIASYHFSEKLI